MQIDNALLQRLEKLSHLKVADDKREEIIGQLNEIVSFVDNLAELDTKNVDDTFAMTANGTTLRKDIPHSQTEVNNDILEHSPHSEEHFFIVPKIIE
ncbi:MAG: Asp-tRNA(Asn)/Glu-tRNA(Gln) amidotransferase GatCAB subunit C [Epsilonproteobacteria bacterium]|nr:MAG: Asp-tRNA(Asn)/Glu-tRNA(Gln) amidotransferase GatCAB subunit C [Campylobacterota bacterium]